MAPKHGEPESRIGNLIRWTLGSVLLVIVLAIAGTLGYNKIFGAQQAVKNDEAISNAKRIADNSSAPATASVTNPGKMWLGWVSEQVLSVGQNDPDYGFPGNTRAVHVGRPDFADGGVVKTAVSLDLTGRHNSTARITAIRIVVDHRSHAPAGTAYLVRPQGDKPKGQISFDLSNLSNTVDGMDEDQRYLDTHTITLEKDESVGFVALVKAGPDSDIKYHFEVSFDSGKNLSVFNGDEPFRLVSYPTTAQRGYMTAFARTANDGFGDAGNFACSWPSECFEYANNLAPK